MNSRTLDAMPRAVAFFDGQNLFHGAKEAFGYRYPNYDVKALAKQICTLCNLDLRECRFYTGLHSRSKDPYWHDFWVAKLAQMGRQGIKTIFRELRYQEVVFKSANGMSFTKHIGNEKGIDVRIALDMVSLTRANFLDAVLLFSQDQDLAEATNEVKDIASEMSRFVHTYCAFPASSSSTNTRGVDRTNWIRIDQTLYDLCIDPRDYRAPV